MFCILDRQMVRSYLKAYLVCLVSLLGLFVVVDLFTNLDDFTQDKREFFEVFDHIAQYYAARIPQIFDRLSEAIVLLAAMFTVALVQRNNEILPLLSAGVSTRRIVRPVLFSAFAMLGLLVLNQEFVLPRIDSYIAENRNDPSGKNEQQVKPGYDTLGIHYSGRSYIKLEGIVKDFTIVIPQKVGAESVILLQAKEAKYFPPGSPGKETGGWLLQQTQPPELPGWKRHDILENIVPGNYFLKTNEIDFDTMARSKNWFMFIPTWQLLKELYRTDPNKLSSVAVIFHMRLTRPILAMLLVFMGLSIILQDQNRNVFISSGLCLILCAGFFVASFVCKYLGDHDFFPPVMAAWLPVLFFGPMSFVMFDAVHT